MGAMEGAGNRGASRFPAVREQKKSPAEAGLWAR